MLSWLIDIVGYFYFKYLSISKQKNMNIGELLESNM